MTNEFNPIGDVKPQEGKHYRMVELSMTEQELIEQIADTYRSFSFWQDKHRRSVEEFEVKFVECANQIYDLLLPHLPALAKEAGYKSSEEVTEAYLAGVNAGVEAGRIGYVELDEPALNK